MSRRQERLRRKLEQNPVMECNKIRQKYCPDLLQDFAKIKDPRHPGYKRYSGKTMLGTMFYKGIAGIISMRSMTNEFNRENVTRNLYRFFGEKEQEFLPHAVTVNEYLERVDPEELQRLQQKQVYGLIRSKAFYDARYRKKWLVIVDGTQLYSGGRKLHDRCLECHSKKGTEKETVNYHCDVLEAKIVLGEDLVVSIGSEFIENNGEDAERQKGMSEEERKQDCEMKAFKRLARKLKEAFPRLPVLLLADSLYASEPVMEQCRRNGWEYLIRYKKGSIPGIMEEYERIPEKGEAGHAEFVNAIDYKGNPVNVLRFWEESIEKGKPIRREFQWLTSMNVTEKNAERLAEVGRKRWKIENEGFNRQKNWQGDITHACSWDANAMKNHYLLIQIADMVKQLYESYFLKKNGIEKRQKNISSDLLASFDRQLTRGEDIFRKEEREALSI